MSNTCTTNYVIRGEKENLEKLYAAIEKASDGDIAELYKAVVGPLPKDPNVNTRGSFEDYILTAIDGVPVIQAITFSAWTACEALMEGILNAFSLRANWYTEEPGCLVYEKHDNDDDFGRNFVVDDSDEGVCYYDSIEEIAHNYRAVLGDDFVKKCATELNAAAMQDVLQLRLKRQASDDGDAFIYVHEIEQF